MSSPEQIIQVTHLNKDYFWYKCEHCVTINKSNSARRKPMKDAPKYKSARPSYHAHGNGLHNMNNGKASRSSGCVYNPDGYTLIINNDSLRIDENDSPYKMNLRK